MSSPASGEPPAGAKSRARRARSELACGSSDPSRSLEWSRDPRFARINQAAQRNEAMSDSMRSTASGLLPSLSVNSASSASR